MNDDGNDDGDDVAFCSDCYFYQILTDGKFTQIVSDLDFAQIVSDWKTKADGLSQELDTSQRECRLDKMISDIVRNDMFLDCLCRRTKILTLWIIKSSTSCPTFAGTPPESCSGSRMGTRSA